MKLYFLSLLAAFASSGAYAQTAISFENKDYKAVSVYDSWEGSPFRPNAKTGKSVLKGNAAVVNNFLKDSFDATQGRVVDSSDKILGFQRSRYGSNLYGVRIDLKEPIRVTKQNQYIHVMTYVADKPSPSRMMVIGLGKRVEKEWAWQDGSDEQFWAVSNNDVSGVDRWQDEVFAFRGFSYPKNENQDLDKGIDIYSLVIVPDVASRSELKNDFVCYFDSIVVDNNPDKRFSTVYYAMPEKSTAVYSNQTRTILFSKRPGESVASGFAFKDGVKDCSVYVDWNKDGEFSSNERTDVDKAGKHLTSFSIPTGTAQGLYRMRYSSTDGKDIVDVMLNVQSDASLIVTQSGLNGDVLDADGRKLDKTNAKAGEPFRVTVKPAPGFKNGGITVRYGYDTSSGQQLDNYGNLKWFTRSFPASSFTGDALTLPADIMIGNSVSIESNFQSATDLQK